MQNSLTVKEKQTKKKNNFENTKSKNNNKVSKNNKSGNKKNIQNKTTQNKNAQVKNAKAKNILKAEKNNTKVKNAKKAQNKVKEPQKQLKTKTKKQVKKPKNETPIRFIPIGGMGEIGKNCYIYEYKDEMILVDCGLTFPDEETPGIDVVIPDFTYVLANKDKIKALIVTHGHEDHIGAIPYLLKNFNLPIYGTRLTLGLIEGKLKEHRLLNSASLNVVNPGTKLTFGNISVELIHVNHSIPDAVALAIKTPTGTVVHTGDFKIDTTPIDDNVIDLGRFAELGKAGVLALLSDSTNAEREGYTASERIVGESFSTLFKKAGKSRIIVASFSSNIHRIQQIIDEAVKCGRKVSVSGRSMQNVVNVAEELGYLNVPENTLVEIENVKKYPDDQMVIITTGSQGEPLSALHRMAFGEHRTIVIAPGDFIIISATPIPGNEKLVSKVVDELINKGATVVYEKMYDVHVSGHACAEELKLMLSLTNPKYFIPMHGEQRHLYKHSKIAQLMGIPKENIIIATNGSVIEIKKSGIKVVDTVTSGRVLVDGLGVGDVGNIVLRDRKHLAEDGVIIVACSVESATHEVVAGPEIISRGFVYVKESEELLDDLNEVVCKIIENNYLSGGNKDYNMLKGKIRDGASKFIYERTRRSPMILPIIMEV